jgi:hypothetical protein
MFPGSWGITVGSGRSNTVNAERYITEELKVYEEKVPLNAEGQPFHCHEQSEFIMTGSGNKPEFVVLQTSKSARRDFILMRYFVLPCSKRKQLLQTHRDG